MADDDVTQPTAVVVENLKRLRRERGMTAQQLSDRLAELEVSLGRIGLSKLEGGKRASITISELFAFSIALNVSPLTLLIPEGEQDDVALTPTTVANSKEVGLWITGSRPLEIGSSEDAFDQPWIAWVSALPAWKRAEYAELLKTFENEIMRKGNQHGDQTD